MLGTILLLGVAGLSGLGAFRWVRNRHPKVEEFVRFRCPGCHRKLRFLASKAGRAGMCPRCRQRWTWPTIRQAVSSATHWGDEYREVVGRRKLPSRSPTRGAAPEFFESGKGRMEVADRVRHDQWAWLFLLIGLGMLLMVGFSWGLRFLIRLVLGS
jgi:hypothetical protein